MNGKKFFAAVASLCVFSAVFTHAQAFLNGSKYIAIFSLKEGENISDNNYVWSAENENYEVFASLSGKDDLIDTNLEFALLSYFSPAVAKARPAGANVQLPANNARVSGLKLGAAVYKELAEIGFFDSGNTAAAGSYGKMLDYISGKNGVTRLQIEQYYRANIKSLVTEIVDDEFNRINFSLTNLSAGKMYYMTLIRNPQNSRYTLYYEVPSATAAVKTISAPARESLFNEMRKRTDEFSSSDIDYVRAQAALMPAVAFPAAVHTDAVNVINAFYLNPNADTYSALGAKWTELFGQKESGQAAASAFSRALVALNDAMAEIGDNSK